MQGTRYKAQGAMCKAQGPSCEVQGTWYMVKSIAQGILYKVHDTAVYRVQQCTGYSSVQGIVVYRVQ